MKLGNFAIRSHEFARRKTMRQEKKPPGLCRCCEHVAAIVDNRGKQVFFETTIPSTEKFTFNFIFTYGQGRDVARDISVTTTSSHPLLVIPPDPLTDYPISSPR
jgi:hypothetical protein